MYVVDIGRATSRSPCQAIRTRGTLSPPSKRNIQFWSSKFLTLNYILPHSFTLYTHSLYQLPLYGPIINNFLNPTAHLSLSQAPPSLSFPLPPPLPHRRRPSSLSLFFPHRASSSVDERPELARRGGVSPRARPSSPPVALLVAPAAWPSASHRQSLCLSHLRPCPSIHSRVRPPLSALLAPDSTWIEEAVEFDASSPFPRRPWRIDVGRRRRMIRGDTRRHGGSSDGGGALEPAPRVLRRGGDTRIERIGLGIGEKGRSEISWSRLDWSTRGAQVTGACGRGRGSPMTSLSPPDLVSFILFGPSPGQVSSPATREVAAPPRPKQRRPHGRPGGWRSSASAPPPSSRREEVKTGGVVDPWQASGDATPQSDDRGSSSSRWR
ncbi:unnamed protein product [Urochloa humidicola]